MKLNQGYIEKRLTLTDRLNTNNIPYLGTSLFLQQIQNSKHSSELNRKDSIG